MNRQPTLFIVLSALTLLLTASQGAAMFYMMTGQNHPELRWRTLETAHFRVHYHQGLEECARQAADVAEQVYGPITRQMGVEPRRRTELAITDADAVVNGFAQRQRINIWVNQNDYIRLFSQDQEWLQQVIAHEFQHVVAYESMWDWRGAMGRALSGTPAWWYEGLAEFYTERWNTLRSDRTLRTETLDGRLKESDAHNAGYAKVLYLAWRDGDSTLVKISRWRHPKLRIHSFDDAFKESTGQTVKAFEAEWSRVMAGIFNAELVAGEELPEIGKRVHLPLERITWLALLPDSSAWLAVGREKVEDQSSSLFRIACDSTARRETLVEGGLRGRGALGADASRVVFDRNGHGRYGALGMDLWTCDLKSGRVERLTHDNHSQDPALAADGTLAWVNTLGPRHRLMAQAPGESARVVWDPGPSWELVRPSFAPDGQRLVLATDDPSSMKRLSFVDLATGQVVHADSLAPDERDPVWVKDSLVVSTVFQGLRANLLARVPGGGSRLVSSSGEGLWGVDVWRGRAGNQVLALALDSARVCRPLLVDADRRAAPLLLHAGERYTAWRDQMPSLRVPKWKRDEHAEIKDDHHYRPWELKPIAVVLLPLPGGALGTAILADPLGRHLVSAVGGLMDKDMPLAEVAWNIHRFAWDVTLSGGWNSRYSLRVVNDKVVESGGSGGGLSLGRRWQWSARPHAELGLLGGLQLVDQERLGAAGDPDALFESQDLRSGTVDFAASWRESAPVRQGNWWPRSGYALRMHASLARPWIHGNEHVDAWGAGAWWMLRHGSRLALVSARLDALSGRRDTWRALGFSPDANLNTLPVLGMELEQRGASPGPVSRVRALDRSLAGDRVAQGTLEFRQSLGKPELLRVLFMKTARVNVAPFLDWGHVADRGRFTASAAEWLWTTGVEAQVEVELGEGVSLGLAGGYGGEGTDWLRKENKDKGVTYWGFHLVRPF